MSSQIDKKYKELGGSEGPLGPPICPEFTCPDGVGRGRHFKNNHSIYWHPKAGAHEVHGLIRNKWATKGWEKGPLGYPKTDERDTVGGRYNLFQHGVILWKRGNPEAFEVHGAIHGKYISNESEKGFLGYPVTDELKTPDGIGRFNHFEDGSIYWKPSIGAHVIYGLIRKFWAEHGWEKNQGLGYPISSERHTKQGDPDRFSDFENGVVYWKQGSSHATQLMSNGLFDRTAGEVFTEIGNHVVKYVTQADSRIYITKSPHPAGILSPPPENSPADLLEPLFALTNYEQKKGGVCNRKYRVIVGFSIALEGTNDPDCLLTLTIEVLFDRPSRTVQSILRHWHIYTEVDWPTSWGISAEEINDILKPKLDKHIGKPIKVATIPEFFNVLSLKVMPNGNLNCYTEPL